MDIQEIANSLHPLERAVLPLIKKEISFKELVEKSKLKEVNVLRAIQWLQDKKIIAIKEEGKEIISLGINGEEALKEGLPERRILDVLDKDLSLDEIEKEAKLDKNEFNIGIGILKKKGFIEIKDKIVSLSAGGKKSKKKELLEEIFIKKLPIEGLKLSEEDKLTLNGLRKRKELISINIIKERTIWLTELGESLSKVAVDENLIEGVTKEVILGKEWDKKKFRSYNLDSFAPRVYPGKKHFVSQAIDYIKKVWLEMGFKEMKGNLVQTSFWNFDALFTAQDHPVRELHDTFFIKGLKGKLPKDERISNRVRMVHENGGDTGSLGWGYKWDPKEALKLVLRTHTTCLSVKTLADLKDMPGKFFSVGKVFRNETVDWSHLFEFNQVEGIVVDPDANFKHLLGYLKQYYKKLGYEDVKFRPAFFPYTSQSTECIVYDKEHKKWIEFGGAGIFRPEVVMPLLGKDIPVLAWGQGLERSILNYYGLKGLREIYDNDLKRLREMKIWR